MAKTIFKMTRPVNIVIAMITLAIGYILEGERTIAIPTLVLQALGFAFSIGFANIENDILDFESDKLNRPDRALPSGKITLKSAKIAYMLMFALTLICGAIDFVYKMESSPIPTTFIFFIALGILLIAYNKTLKHVPLLKNMTVAFLCMTPLVLCLVTQPANGSLDMDLVKSRLGMLYPAMVFAFLLTTAREIYKDLEDEVGDLKAGIMTFPLIAGAPTARRFAGALLLFTWILLPLPVLQGFYPKIFLVLTLCLLTPIFTYITVQASRRNYHKAQSQTKIAMFLGLLSLIVGIAV